MIGKLDDYLRFNEAVLSIRGQRQQLLASNIANADTPNYKARDIDFNSALQNALSQAEQPQSPLTQTAGAHQAGQGNKDIFAGVPLQYRTTYQGAVDGNTVDMDIERNQFTDNAIRYEAGVNFINGQIKNLLAAIQG